MSPAMRVAPVSLPCILDLTFRSANVIHDLLFAIVGAAAYCGAFEKFPCAASQMFHNAFFAIVHCCHSTRNPYCISVLLYCYRSSQKD